MWAGRNDLLDKESVSEVTLCNFWGYLMVLFFRQETSRNCEMPKPLERPLVHLVLVATLVRSLS